MEDEDSLRRRKRTRRKEEAFTRIADGIGMIVPFHADKTNHKMEENADFSTNCSTVAKK